MLNTQFESVNTKFESERIVILGGTSGIGLATAERAAADGATVIVASSSAERIDAALERLPASAEGYTVDVRHEEQIRDLFSRLGSFDHLAFTAGETLQLGAIADTDLDAARRAPTSSERISMAWVVHPPTPDSDDGHPGGVLMRGTPAETSGGSDATRKRRAIYLASHEAAVVDRTVIVVDGARRSAAVIASA